MFCCACTSCAKTGAVHQRALTLALLIEDTQTVEQILQILGAVASMFSLIASNNHLNNSLAILFSAVGQSTKEDSKRSKTNSWKIQPGSLLDVWLENVECIGLVPPFLGGAIPCG